MPSIYPNGFSQTLVVRDLPIQVVQPGRVFWLNNSGVVGYGSIPGSLTANGSYASPFLTLQAAINYITARSGANRGDVLMVACGHSETISSATALTLNCAGLMIVGQGTGTKRPMFTLDTANTSTINVAADNITIANCQFVANFLAIASCFTLSTAKNFCLSNVEVRDTSAILNFAKVVSTGITDNAADGLIIENCQAVSLHATNAWSVLGANANMANVQMNKNYIRSVTTNAAAVLAPIATGKVLTDVRVDNNKIITVGATGTTTGVLFTTNGSTNSGLISNNFVRNLATTAIQATASSGFSYMNNYYNNTADVSGKLLPVVNS